MHIPYDPHSIDWDLVFREQIVQQGSGYYQGYQFQRGASGLGGFLSKLLSIVLPIAKQATRAIGAEALQASGRIVDDLSAGRAFGDSIRDHGPKAYRNLIDKAVEKLNQKGGGRKKSRAVVKKPRKTVKKKRVKKTKKSNKSAKRKRTVAKDIFGKWAS